MSLFNSGWWITLREMIPSSLKGRTFLTYKITSALQNDENMPSNYLTFAKILHKVFPGSDKRNKVYGKQTTVYQLKWRKQINEKDSGVLEFEPNVIVSSCPSNYTVLSSCELSVKITTESGHV
jgi:hypothetical protein